MLSQKLSLCVARTWDGTPIPRAERVRFEIRDAGPALRIEVEAPFHDDPPPPGRPGPTDGLWEHEVVELFVVGGARGGEPEPEYTELELSPHGHYLLLRHRGVRQVVERLLAIDFTARISGGRWRGAALLPRELLPAAPHRVNAFAIHGSGAERRYLAMTPVPGRRPDFHRLDVFETLELPGVLTSGTVISGRPVSGRR